MKIYDYNGKKNISGDRIREARQKIRLSQADLAARMQVEGIPIERDSISRVEIGTRFVPDYEVPVFAKVLNVSVAWLLGLPEGADENDRSLSQCIDLVLKEHLRRLEEQTQ